MAAERRDASKGYDTRSLAIDSGGRGYNPAVVQVDRRRAASGILVVLVVTAVLLTQLPFDVAGVRFGGLSLLWWYAGVAGPMVATVVALLALTDRTS